MSDKFRAGAAAVIFRDDGKILAFRRSGKQDSWQMPQGGLEKGEDPLEGVFREIHEETNIRRKKLQLIDEHPEWLAYQFPEELQDKRCRGQVHKWFLFQFVGREKDIDPRSAKDAEFDDWCWTTPQQLIDSIISFKRTTYARVFEYFAPIIDRAKK